MMRGQILATQRSLGHIASQYWALTKPRVTQLAIFCAVIGMFLATSELPSARTVAMATLGIWLLAGAAFAVNSLIERHIDARMARTRMRPLPHGDLTPLQALAFSGVIGGAGMWVLHTQVNPLTMWLTFATFVGYAVVYTVLLKPYTPQNIVIGGMSGAMPPVLGWAAVTDSAPPEAWLLALIIFVWTPPHFWALALYRIDDYRKAGWPMLPVTHGEPLTRLHILLTRSGWWPRRCCPMPCRCRECFTWCRRSHSGRCSSPTRGGSSVLRTPPWRVPPSITRSFTWQRSSRPCWSITTSELPRRRSYADDGPAARARGFRRCRVGVRVDRLLAADLQGGRHHGRSLRD
jgi:protoheme IX farnesyltransferase